MMKVKWNPRAYACFAALSIVIMSCKIEEERVIAFPAVFNFPLPKGNASLYIETFDKASMAIVLTGC
jgi:hypothetical protein